MPVLWVGLPSVRGTRATSDMVYLNDLYRGRAEKAGIVYVDVWDGFVDEAGNYNNYMARTSRARRGACAPATACTSPSAGARKLAHYAEREIRRLMLARATPLALPAAGAGAGADAKARPPPPRPACRRARSRAR